MAVRLAAACRLTAACGCLARILCAGLRIPILLDGGPPLAFKDSAKSAAENLGDFGSTLRRSQCSISRGTRLAGGVFALVGEPVKRFGPEVCASPSVLRRGEGRQQVREAALVEPLLREIDYCLVQAPVGVGD